MRIAYIDVCRDGVMRIVCWVKGKRFHLLFSKQKGRSRSFQYLRVQVPKIDTYLTFPGFFLFIFSYNF